MIFDSVFNSFRGIIAYFKIENGVIRKGDKVKFFNTGKEYDADEIGVLKMDMIPVRNCAQEMWGISFRASRPRAR